MKREKFFMAVLAILVLTGAARADTIEPFAILGTACCVGHSDRTSFSGSLKIDITSGTITAVDITFPGLAAFTRLEFQAPSSGIGWFFAGSNNRRDVFALSFDTRPIPGSLVGFMRGTLTGGNVSSEPQLGGQTFFFMIEGDIVPVPEPSSLALLGTGLISLGGMLRRKLKR